MPRRPNLSAVLAALLYLVVAAWTVRVLVPAPRSVFPVPVDLDNQWRGIVEADQKMVAATIAYDARTWITAPWRLMDGNQCYPAPNALTLGEHMLGDGLLGVVPNLVSGDPVVTYNVVVPLTYWIAALAMYALVYSWTKSPSAALIAGLLFAFHPARLRDVAHPYVVGNQWTPLAFLFADRLVLSARWRDVAGLVLFVGLQMLESIYTLLALTIVGGVYGAYLLVRNAGRLRALAPKLFVAAIVITAWGAAIFHPYLATRAAWGTLSGRTSIEFALRDFALGGPSYPGSVLLLLAGLALVDRWRGGREERGYDPRLAYLAAGLLVLWCAVGQLWIPIVDRAVPSLFVLLSLLLPGMDALRGAGTVRSGVYLAGAVLAGYGVLVILERLRPIWRAIATLVLVSVALLEIFWAPLATRAFGSSVDMQAVQVRPPPALLELCRKVPAGAVLDFPFQPGARATADNVFLGAYHHRPIAACYNSFKLPTALEIQRLTERLPRDYRAADALYALGFRSVIVARTFVPGRKLAFSLMPRPAPPYLAELGAASGYELYRIAREEPVSASFAPLAASPPVTTLVAAPPEATLGLSVANRTSTTYRHPDPIVPTMLVTRWLDESGAIVEEDHTSALLPLALAAGEEQQLLLRMPIPTSTGEYRLTVAPAATPDVVIAVAMVHVRAETQ